MNDEVKVEKIYYGLSGIFFIMDDVQLSLIDE